MRIKINIRLITTFLFIASVIISCTSQKEAAKKIHKLNHLDSAKSLVLNIDFQKKFSHDTVSVTINGLPVFDTVLLTTQTVTDFTQFRVNIYSLGKNKIAVSYFGITDNDIDYTGKIKFLQTHISTLNLVITINKTMNKFTIDTNRGRYLGFSKLPNDGLGLFQKSRSFIYD